VDFEAAQRITRQVAQKILEKGLPEGVDFVNLNIPSQVESDEILITRLGERMYNVHIQKRLDPRGRPYYWLDGDPVEDDGAGTDVHTLKMEKKATLTPLSLDCTSDVKFMDGWLEK